MLRGLHSVSPYRSMQPSPFKPSHVEKINDHRSMKRYEMSLSRVLVSVLNLVISL